MLLLMGLLMRRLLVMIQLPTMGLELLVTVSFASALVIIIVEAAALLLLLLLLLHVVVLHAAITTTVSKMISMVAHTILRATVCTVSGIVLVLVLVVVATVTASRLLVASAGLSRRVIIIVWLVAIATGLTHWLRVAKSALNSSSKLSISIIVAQLSLMLSHVGLLAVVHGIAIGRHSGNGHARR